MKRYGVLACLSLLCLSACECGSRQADLEDSAIADVIVLSPEKAFEIKSGEAVDAVWKRLGPATSTGLGAADTYFYKLAPQGSVILDMRGFDSSYVVGGIGVVWSSSVDGEGPSVGQFSAVEHDGSPYPLSVPLSALERSRRHAPTRFLRLVGLSRDEAAGRIGVKLQDLAGEIVRLRLAPRGYADVRFEPEGRVGKVDLVWDSRAK